MKNQNNFVYYAASCLSYFVIFFYVILKLTRIFSLISCSRAFFRFFNCCCTITNTHEKERNKKLHFMCTQTWNYLRWRLMQSSFTFIAKKKKQSMKPFVCKPNELCINWQDASRTMWFYALLLQHSHLVFSLSSFPTFFYISFDQHAWHLWINLGFLSFYVFVCQLLDYPTINKSHTKCKL